MIRTIFEKELRLTLATSRFVACSLLLVTLMTASALVMLADWQRRLDLFRASSQEAERAAHAATAYVEVALRLERRPQLLSLIHQGVGDRFGRFVALAGKYDLPRLQGGMSESTLLESWIPLDFSHLVGIVLSLIALIFSYDLVNGDRASGTLQLTLASSLSRSRLLLGKYLGAMVSVTVPFMAATVLWLLIVLPQSDAEAGAGTWVRIGLALLLAVMYASIFIWLGLLLSALTDRPATSLILGLLVWTLVVLIYPILAVQVIEITKPVQRLAVERPGQDALIRDPALRAHVEAAQWEVFRRALGQFHRAQVLMRLSPLSQYDFASAAVAGTDVDHFMTLLDAARREDQALRTWQEGKARLYPDRELSRMNVPLPLDLSGLPQTRKPLERLAEVAGRVLPDAALLIIFNLFLMICSLYAFQRYDVRL